MCSIFVVVCYPLGESAHFCAYSWARLLSWKNYAHVDPVHLKTCASRLCARLQSNWSECNTLTIIFLLLLFKSASFDPDMAQVCCIITFPRLHQLRLFFFYKLNCLGSRFFCTTWIHFFLFKCYDLESLSCLYISRLAFPFIRVFFALATAFCLFSMVFFSFSFKRIERRGD